MVLTTGHSRKKAQSCSRRSEEATKNYRIIKQSQSRQKSRPETTPGSKMNNGINHGTQPQKGTILLPTERRSDQKLSHNKAEKKQSRSGQKSRPETTPGSKMNNGINHGTQPQKGQSCSDGAKKRPKTIA
jgi:hypothetical protein